MQFALEFTIFGVVITLAIIYRSYKAFQRGEPMSYHMAAAYLIFVMLPHLFIYNLESYPSAYATFTRGESWKALLLAEGSGLLMFLLPGWICFVPKGAWTRFTDWFVKKTNTFVRVVGPYMIAYGVILVAAGVWFAMKGTRSVGLSLAQAIWTGELEQFRQEYNAIRFDIEKSAVLLSGIRGLGTLTLVIKLGVLGIAGLGSYMFVRLRRLPQFLLFVSAVSAAGFVLLTSGARSDLLQFLGSIAIGIISGLRRKVFASIACAAIIFLAYTAFTSMTPKIGEIPSSVGESSTLLNLLQRIPANAVNDILMMDLCDAGAIQIPTTAAPEPVDLQLNRLLTQDNSDWYETPTEVGFSYAYGGVWGVLLNAYGAAIFIRLALITSRRTNPALALLTGLFDFIIAYRFCFAGVFYMPVYILALFAKEAFTAVFEQMLQQAGIDSEHEVEAPAGLPVLQPRLS
jgi:hypothetical protein